MSNPLAIDPSRIPDLGAPCEVYMGDISVVFRCKCRPENRPVLLTSVNAAVLCAGCRGVYQIVQVEFALGRTQLPRIAVGLVGHAPEQKDEKRILK